MPRSLIEFELSEVQQCQKRAVELNQVFRIHRQIEEVS